MPCHATSLFLKPHKSITPCVSRQQPDSRETATEKGRPNKRVNYRSPPKGAERGVSTIENPERRPHRQGPRRGWPATHSWHSRLVGTTPACPSARGDHPEVRIACPGSRTDLMRGRRRGPEFARRASTRRGLGLTTTRHASGAYRA